MPAGVRLMKVRKAIVLAAGLGTRLRPFTCATPKPLMPVWGEPMLSRIVSMLREWGVDDIVFNAHCLHAQVEEWVSKYARDAKSAGDGVSVKVSYEPEILGTGGVLNPLRDWIGGEPFYLVNGDIVVENAPDPAKAARGLDRADVIAAALVSEMGPRTIEVEPESGFVTNWKSDDAGCEGTFTYCGIAAIKAQILDFVKSEGFSSIIQAYESAMMQGLFVKAVHADEMLWADAGTVQSYIDLNRDGEDNAFDELPQVRAALESVGAKPSVTFMGARGSERVFFRCDKGVIIVYDDANRAENGLYAGHARYLKSKGVPVPDVLSDLVSMKTLVLEDAGETKKMTFDDYVKVVEALAKFNAIGADPSIGEMPLQPAFDDAMWKWERDLFREHCLASRFFMEMPEAVGRELESVAARLEKEPKALVHRDFQSTNVIWKGDGFKIIDFQGMRLGPAAYDLASLLYDPYVRLSDRQREALAALYAKVSGRPEIVEVLPFAAVQRLVQALGAFGRLASVGQPQFGDFVLPALENLLAAADEAGLDAVGALAEDLIAKETRRRKEKARPADGKCACGHDHAHEGHGHQCHCHDHGHDHGHCDCGGES